MRSPKRWSDPLRRKRTRAGRAGRRRTRPKVGGVAYCRPVPRRLAEHHVVHAYALRAFAPDGRRQHVLRRHQAERHKRAQQYPRAQGRRRHRRERARQRRGALPRRAEHEWHDRNRKRHEQEWATRDDHRAHRILEEGRQRGCREARLVLRAFAPGHGRLACAAAVPFARRHGAQLLRLGAIGAELRARCVGRGRSGTHDDATQSRRPSEKSIPVDKTAERARLCAERQIPQSGFVLSECIYHGVTTSPFVYPRLSDASPRTIYKSSDLPAVNAAPPHRSFLRSSAPERCRSPLRPRSFANSSSIAPLHAGVVAPVRDPFRGSRGPRQPPPP